MYEYLLDRAIRLARAGEGDPDVIEAALVAMFEAKRFPGAATVIPWRQARHATAGRVGRGQRDRDPRGQAYGAGGQALADPCSSPIGGGS